MTDLVTYPFTFAKVVSFSRLARLTLSVLLLSLFIALQPLKAQLSQGGEPSQAAVQLRSSVTANPVVLKAPTEQDFDAYCREQEAASGDFRVFHLGMPIEMALSPSNSGQLARDGEGRTIWQLALEAKGARTLQLYFSRFRLPEGGRLFLLSPEGEVLKGAFTEVNNTTLNALTIAPIKGDRVQLFYEGPQNSEALPDLLLSQVTYGFRVFGEHPAKGIHKPGEPWFKGGTLCAPNVVTEAGVSLQAQSLVLLVVRNNSVCSGALINNTAEDGTAYVLTAAHCMNNSFQMPGYKPYRDESAKRTVFFFNFRSPLGNQLVRGVEEQSLSGAEIVAFDEARDLCLLKIKGIDPNPLWAKSGGIPASYLPYYSGWNASPTPEGEFVGLHHPAACVARYSRCADKKLEIADYSAGSSIKWVQSHFHIPRWEVGSTAGGSSGSPLYDSKMRIVGALSGGGSYCPTPVNDFYYAISKCFELGNKKPEERLAPWLDPKKSGVKELGGLSPYAPLSTVRLSYNYYSVRRDAVELPPKVPIEGLVGIANAYPVKAKSNLLGLLITAELKKIDSKLDLVVIAEDTLGQRRELLRKAFKTPTFNQWNGEKISPVERTLGGLIEFFVPLADANGEPIAIGQGETLFVGFESPEGTSFPMSILRSEPHAGVSSNAYAKLSDAKAWIKANDPSVPKSLSYNGNYWIDPILFPLELSSVPSATRPNAPTAYILDGKLRVMLPSGIADQVDVALYSMDGRQLFSVSSRAEVADFDLPRLVLDEQRVVMYFTFGKEKYGRMTLTSFGNP